MSGENGLKTTKGIMMYAFKLSEITAMQLGAIKQLNELKKTILDIRKTRRSNSMQGKDVLFDIDQEIKQRKEWAMNPSLVQV